MARGLNRLTDAFCRTVTERKPHADGGGLYLNVDRRHGGRSWVFRWTPRGGKPRYMGLGPYPAVSLGRARRKAIECRAAVVEGRDPIAERRREAEPTFGECAEKCIASLESGWRSGEHRRQWRQTIDTYCKPILDKRVSEIGTEDILGVLRLLWTTRHVTGTRVRNRIEIVLDYAGAHGWRQGENPARWRGHLNKLLPKPPKLQKAHHSAMPYSQIGAFLDRLRGLEAMPAWAAQLIFLTACRRGEVLGMTWDEVDFDEGLWTIPAIRTKPGAMHQVPLSRQAMALLAKMRETQHSRYVFTGFSPDKPLSPSAVDGLLGRLEFAYTLHGSSRSAFRDWAGDLTTHQREVAETALGHAVGGAVERSYRRGSAIEKRRKLMQDWADYLDGAAGAKVINLRRR